MVTMLMEKYSQIKSKLESHGITVGDVKEINYGIQFPVSKGSWSKTFRIYNGKKGIRIDCSQLGTDPVANEIRQIVEGPSTSTKSPIRSHKPRIETSNFDYPVIGTDESGKGDYFGHLITAGVFVDKVSARMLQTAGVRDCKKLSDSQNLMLAKKVKQICAGRYAIIDLKPSVYNEKYEKISNLNTLLGECHASAIKEVLGKLDKVDCSRAIVDQFAKNESVVKVSLSKKGIDMEIIQMHRAEESSIAVAAASILARARFIERMDDMSKKYNFRFPKGASNVIGAATEFVSKYGEDELKNVAKLHFKTTSQVLS